MYEMSLFVIIWTLAALHCHRGVLQLSALNNTRARNPVCFSPVIYSRLHLWKKVTCTRSFVCSERRFSCVHWHQLKKERNNFAMGIVFLPSYSYLRQSLEALVFTILSRWLENIELSSRCARSFYSTFCWVNRCRRECFFVLIVIWMLLRVLQLAERTLELEALPLCEF